MKIITPSKINIEDLKNAIDDVLVSSNRNQCTCTDTDCGCGL